MGHVNVLANMMFGSISGPGGRRRRCGRGTLNPIQTQKGYDPAFSTAVNVSILHHGPAHSAIKRADRLSLTAGGVSVASLFMAGYCRAF
ncbi:hypothetical protein LNP25_03595 [Klebsiella variicola subsp. variicola]|nr:hypothetical protein [Klebsiella variicola subsp. variicola]